MGNLILGYNEQRTDVPWNCSNPRCFNNAKRTGSHHLVIGLYHEYRRSSGGVVAGLPNSAGRDWAAVTGGRYNSASGEYSSVSGGSNNGANRGLRERQRRLGPPGARGGVRCARGAATRPSTRPQSGAAAITRPDSGPQSAEVICHETPGELATAVGGQGNIASGDRSTVSGGYGNQAAERWATVSGGANNQAVGQYASVTGGDPTLHLSSRLSGMSR